MTFLRRTLVLALFLALTGTAASQTINNGNLRNSKQVLQAFREVVAKPSEATVRVIADGKEVAFGTITGADGWILTKWDEIKNKNEIICKLKGGKTLPAKLVGHHDDFDLAMLKVNTPEPLPTVQWRSSKDATVGKWVASVSTGAEPIAVGVVSVAPRPFKKGDQPPRRTPDPNSGMLGVKLAPSLGGAKIAEVTEKSAAEKAGLKANDIVYEAAGRKIADDQSLIETIQRLRAGDNVLLKVKRGEEDLELKATLGKIDKELLKELLNPQETMGTKLSLRRGGFPVILQHDSGVRPEDCGGPLVDLDGKAVGINIARAGRTETYAIPSDSVKDLLADLMSGKLTAKADADDPDLVLRKVRSLTAKDEFDKNRPMMKANRHMKTEEVALTAGTTYVIEMNSTEIECYLILEDVNGNKLDRAGFPKAKIVFTPKADGTYRIIATSFNANETGAFTLTVRKAKK